MPEYSKTDVQNKLNKSWSVLSGKPLEFKIVNGPINPDDSSYHFGLPIRFTQNDPLAAVALEISKAHAINLSAAMYDMAATDLTEDDIMDVCSEMCNVFSANVCNAFSNNKEGSIDLPNKLTTSEFRYIFEGSNLDCFFQAENEEGRIVIYMFDPCNYYN